MVKESDKLGRTGCGKSNGGRVAVTVFRSEGRSSSGKRVRTVMKKGDRKSISGFYSCFMVVN